MGTPLCEVVVPITGEQRRQLQLACQRLGISWPTVRSRVMAACQDAATRAIGQLLQDAQEATSTPRAQLGYPDCSTCRTMRAETCADCERVWLSTTTAEVRCE